MAYRPDRELSPYLALRNRRIYRPSETVEPLRYPDELNSYRADSVVGPESSRISESLRGSQLHDASSSTPVTRRADRSPSWAPLSDRQGSAASLWHPGSTSDLFERWMRGPQTSGVEDEEVQLNGANQRNSRRSRMDPKTVGAERLPTQSLERPSLARTDFSQQHANLSRGGQGPQSEYDRGHLEDSRPYRSDYMYNSAPNANVPYEPLLRRDYDQVPMDGPSQAPVVSYRDLAGPRMIKRTHKEVPAPKFDGKSVSFLEFMDDFERVADYNGWNSEDRKFHLWNSITGNAKIRIKTIAYPASYGDLLSRLLLVFNNERSVEGYRDRLAEIRRDLSMDLETFGHHLLDLVRKAHPGTMPDEQERIARDRFLETAGSHNLYVWLKANKPPTVQSAIDLAIQFQQATAANSAKKPSMANNSSELAVSNLFMEEGQTAVKVSAAITEPVKAPESALEAQVKSLAEEVKILTQALKTKKSQKGPVKCYGCQEIGHIKRNCPKLQSLN